MCHPELVSGSEMLKYIQHDIVSIFHDHDLINCKYVPKSKRR